MVTLYWVGYLELAYKPNEQYDPNADSTNKRVHVTPKNTLPSENDMYISPIIIKVATAKKIPTTF
jgi:hypothetical protein